MLGSTWGASVVERAAKRPCDDLAPNAYRFDRAISIDAPPAVVFSWLCQMRAAPYSYDFLDNTGRRSPRTRSAELTDLAVGQRFVRIFGRVHVFELVAFSPDEYITLQQRDFGRITQIANVLNTYALDPEGSGTRLHVRVLFEGRWLLGQTLALVNLMMMRKQLRTFKTLAERDALRV